MLFQNEFEDDNGFEFSAPKTLEDDTLKIKADVDEVDSVVSADKNFAKITRKSDLELLLQKANSISGIRKMNI
jgi:hypothetical protein